MVQVWYNEKINFFAENDFILFLFQTAPHETCPPATVAGLTTLKGQLDTVNNAVAPIVVTANTSRITHYHLLYDDDSGMVDVAQKCKDYVKSIFVAATPAYALVSGIKFLRNND